jgi:hypothetical protein
VIQIRTRVRFDKGRVKKKVQAANFRSLGHAAATIRLTAKRSIRKRKKPSNPGSPPSTQTGMLRRVLRYEVNRNREEAVIGPVNEIAGRLWNLHEFGGVVIKRRKLKRRRFRVGQHGPIRATARGKFVRATSANRRPGQSCHTVGRGRKRTSRCQQATTLSQASVHETGPASQPVTSAQVLA